MATNPRKMFPAVNSVGSAYAARRGRRAGERGSIEPLLETKLGHACPDTCLRRARMLDPPETCSPALTAISHSGPKKTSTREPNLIRPTRSPFATRSPSFFVEHDAARNQSGDLREADAGSFSFDGDCVALVCGTGHLAARHQEMALGVLHLRDLAAHGRPIHMDIENVQEDADAGALGAIGPNTDHFAVGRRHSNGTFRDGTIQDLEKNRGKIARAGTAAPRTRGGSGTRPLRLRRRAPGHNRSRRSPSTLLL